MLHGVRAGVQPGGAAPLGLPAPAADVGAHADEPAAGGGGPRPPPARRRHRRPPTRRRRGRATTCSGCCWPPGTRRHRCRSRERGHGGREAAMSDAELTDQVLGFLLAGHETTATTLALSLLRLAAEPRWQRVLHDEVDAVLGDRPPTADDLPRLVWTDRVVREVLRLWPSAPTTVRQAPQGDTVLGYALPPGAVALAVPLRHPPLAGAVARPRPVRPGAVRRGAARRAPLRLVPLRRRPARLRRGPAGAGRGDPGSRGAAAAVPAEPPSSPSRRWTSASCSGRRLPCPCGWPCAAEGPAAPRRHPRVPSSAATGATTRVAAPAPRPGRRCGLGGGALRPPPLEDRLDVHQAHRHRRSARCSAGGRPRGPSR